MVARRKKDSGSRKRTNEKPETHLPTRQSIKAVALLAASAVLFLASFGEAGFLGSFIFNVMKFFFGRAAFLVPVSLLLVSVAILTHVRRHITAHTGLGFILFLVSTLGLGEVLLSQKAARLSDGQAGLVGFVVGYPLIKLFAFWGALIILIAACVVSLLIIFNIPLIMKREKKQGASLVAPEPMPVVVVSPPITQAMPIPQKIKKGPDEKHHEFDVARPLTFGDYAAPPLKLLSGDQGTPSSGDIRANANIIKRTLQNFGIEVEMSEVHVGPSVTQYTLKPAEGVKLSRITALHRDLALALAAKSLRIEAPIPGRALVGIEVPNRSVSLVGLRSLLEDDQFQSSRSPLILAIGRDVAGSAVCADLHGMPHLLIAGSTGSGKSVAIHALVLSLLYRNPPQFLNFIFIDPKRVELNIYNDIPHLVTPVITDSKHAVQALVWATKEMDRRYDLLSQAKCRNISEYNEHVMDRPQDIMPYLVIVIDELADLMASYGRAVEGSIVRLAQLSRAVGLHLVVSTQRPSVDVITGLIKANITARMALSVASQVDSRTILDMMGAEKLLGNGDMLFVSSDTSKARRIQGAFVSTKEVKAVVEFLKSGSGNIAETIDFSSVPASVDFSVRGSEDALNDELYEEAKKLVIEAGKASASYLQRRLRVGYSRAARLLDILEERGVVGPADGSNPREVYISENSNDENKV